MQEKVEGKNEILELLRNFISEKKIVSIFSEPEKTYRFSSGYVVAVTDALVLMALLDPSGKYFGFGTFVSKDIYSIEYDGKYGNKLAILHTLNERKHADIELLTGDVILDILTFAHNNALIVTIEMHASELDDYQGFVTGIGDGVLTLKAIDRYGVHDGFAALNIRDITHIFCDTDSEASLKQIHDFRYLDKNN